VSEGGVLDSSGAAGGRGFRRGQSSDMEATCGDHVTNGSKNSWLSSVELRTLKPNVRAVHVVPPTSPRLASCRRTDSGQRRRKTWGP
jgi:hypothetical protein